MQNVYYLALQCKVPQKVIREGNEVEVMVDEEVAFDYVEDSQTNLNSDITTHPLVTGDTIADHKYNTPTTMTVNGNFSLQGNKPSPFLGDYSDRLSNIEAFFEGLKDRGTMCRLVKLSKSDKSSVRFMARDNMVLTSISWTERQNSLGFSFNFTEVMTGDVDEYDIDETDEDLPALTDPNVLSFTELMLNMDDVDRIVQEIFEEKGLISPQFVLKFNAVSTVASAVGVGALAAAGATAAGVIGLSIPVVGWIAVAAGALAVAIGAVVAGTIEENQQRQAIAAAEREYAVEAFKVYEDERQMSAEIERYANYLGRIHQNLQTLNDHMLLYGIPSNENQELSINVDGFYYVFKFTKNNTSKKWSLTIDDINNDRHLRIIDELTAAIDMSELTSRNYTATLVNGKYFCYVMNFKLKELMSTMAKQREIDEATADLRNYAIFITSINMDEFKDALRDIVNEAMTR